MSYIIKCGIVLLIVYPLIPFLLQISDALKRHCIFANFVRYPFFTDFNDLPSCGVTSAGRNFHLSSAPEIELGIWHITPQSEKDTTFSDDDFMRSLSDNSPIILYLHGNSGHRALSHRVELYNVLSAMDYHVIAVDYRGYADSAGTPSDAGVVEDALRVYEWITEHKTKQTPVIIWGHSMGAAVGAAVSKKLCDAYKCPHGLVLESPFLNIRQGVEDNPSSLPFWIFPWFGGMVDAFERYCSLFKTDRWLTDIHSPLLILHAEDDNIIPHWHGEQLYKIALGLESRSGLHTQFVSYAAEQEYGHKYIHTDADLPAIVRNFVKVSEKEMISAETF